MKKPPEGDDRLHMNHGEGWAAAEKKKSDGTALHVTIDPASGRPVNEHGENYRRGGGRGGPKGV